MSSDTRYFNRSRMLPAHNKNKSHMPQPSPLSMKRSKSARKSLEMMGRRSERESRSSTPTPIDKKLPEIPKLQVLPNGQKPNFGNSSNSNHAHHHQQQHHNHTNTQSHSQIHNHAGKNKDLSTSKNKNHSRRKSSGNEKSSKRSVQTGNDKIDRNLKKDPHKKGDKINAASTEVVTNQLKNLLINDSGKSSDVKNSTKVQNNPSPLTTFMTSPIITPETIPPQLKIENNTVLGKTLLLPSIQQNSQFINTNSQQQQFNHSLSNNPSITSKQPNNITSLPLLPHPAPISPMSVNNRAPLSIINGIVNSPIMYPLTSFQMSNNVRPLPFGNTNMNYSITNTPLPMPPFVTPPLVLPQQSPLNSSNLVEAKDINTNNLNSSLLPESISNQDMKIISNKSYHATTNENNTIKHNKNTNKKTSHSFAGASFATDIPQECNLPKPSFL